MLTLLPARVPKLQGASEHVVSNYCHARTRAEFQGWAQPLAAAHGYDVHFTGIGRLRPEALKAVPSAFAEAVAAEPALGCATQAAFFVRQR